MHEKRLKKLLASWQIKGLLTEQQTQAIISFEMTKKSSSRALWALVIIAALSIGLGVINIIAANWDLIPGWLKLACYFGVIFGVVLGILKEDTKPRVMISEALHFIYIILIIAGIGLIAQVFHVPSDGWRGFALWCGLGFPIMLRSRTCYTALLWYGSFAAAWMGWIFQVDHLLSQRMDLFCLVCVLLGMAATWDYKWSLPRPFRIVTILITGSFVFLAYPWISVLLDHSKGDGSIELKFIVGMIAGGAWLVTASMGLGLRLSQVVIAGTALLSFFCRWVLVERYGVKVIDHWPNLLETMLFVVQLTSLGVLSIPFGFHRFFDFLTFLMAARILVLFMTLFGSLLMTGAGLIAFGVLVMLVVFMWYKHRERLFGFFGGRLR